MNTLNMIIPSTSAKSKRIKVALTNDYSNKNFDKSSRRCHVCGKNI